jgi:hypothetical protein
MELMPAGIRERELFRLLGDLLSPQIRGHSTGALRLRLMQHGFSWQALVELASGQDVLPPLIFALSVRRLLPPIPRSPKNGNDAHVAIRLGEYYRGHLARRQLAKSQLQNVLSALNHAGIVPLILKGARYLLAPHESWYEARAIRDIDLLVRQYEADRTVAALEAQGYRLGSPYMADYHHLAALERPGDPVPVEIHTDALAFNAQRLASTEFVWTHSAKNDSGTFFFMPDRWQALHCLLHHQLSDHGYSRQILAVKALWEWAMLTRGFSREDWEALAAHMQAAGGSDLLGSWVVQSHRLFGVKIPEYIAISPQAYRNASATFELATKAHWRRRAHFVLDQLRSSFARETLGKRYGKSVADVSLMDAGRYMAYLCKLHRGRWLRRLIGHPERPS